MSISANKSGGGDLGLSLTGMRIAPRDPNTHVAKVGIKQEVYKPEHTLGSLQPRMMKERSGFSGGFKIPEEFRKSKQKKKGLMSDQEQEEDLEATQQSQITKDEIVNSLINNLNIQRQSQLNLASDGGRGGANSKAALAKDLVDGIEKDLEKLKRQQENLQLRKQLALTGQSVVEETQQEKEKEMEYKLKYELENAGAHVIAASPKKLQVMRHQASQLGSIKNLELEEIEQMRAENERRLKQLEEIYNRKKENSSVGRIIRDRMGYSMNDKTTPREPNFDRDVNESEEEEQTFSAKKKKVRIADNKENHHDDNLNDDIKKELKTAQFGLSKPQTRIGGRSPGKSLNFDHKPSKSRSFSRKKKEDSPIQYDSPRRKLYEAKFEKYISNKDQKVKQEKKLEKYQKEDFDRYTKGPDSPAKSSKRFKSKEGHKETSKQDYDSLIPQNYDETLMLKEQAERKLREQKEKNDPFKRLGVSTEDKMTFFLLKWIFNAIKRESSEEDPKLKGKSYVTKQDLVKQLSKNDELMVALGYHRPEEINSAVKKQMTVKEGCLVWEEFLDFFFLRQNQLQKKGDDDNWWRNIGNSEQKKPEEQVDNVEDQMKYNQQSPNKNLTGVPRYGAQAGNQQQFYIPPQDDPDKKPVKMTESLKILADTRKQKVAQEVEEEFKTLQERKALEQKANKQSNIGATSGKKKKGQNDWEFQGYDDEDAFLQEQLGIKREKSECLLLQSQIYIMEEIYKALDKYNDAILRRNQFIMALRTDERVVEFIDQDAVKVPGSTGRVLTLDEVLVEIEKDEIFEMTQIGKNSTQINHKEFITWREFMTYFNDYREIEERNRKTKEIQRTRQSLIKERQNTTEGSGEGGIEITSLMEKERMRRLQELPKLRPADQIDITEKQLQLLRDIYDSLPRAANGKDMINTIDFFISTRKNPQLRAIASTIARDPEGYSRIPRETFQQVFDRMENDIQAKQIDWALIVEYFTKRGRPLSKDEIQKLIEDDKREREEEEMKKRQEEEAERRRMARLMEDLEDKEDFEEFEMRQKSEQAEKILNEKKYERKRRDQDEDEQEDEDDYDEEAYEIRGRSKRRNHDYDSEDREDYGDEDDIDRDYDEGYTSDPELRTAKRTYKFGGDNYNSQHSLRKERAQSAKPRGRNHRGKSDHGVSFDERDLKHTKLTTKDYIDHERSQSRKKGKYGITVPKPFNFDMRDKTKPKTIREKKVEEMIAEKKLQEEAIIKHQFRPKPIPPEVSMPRYKTIMEANEMRRLQTKQNSEAITKAREKPFSFYERDKQKQKQDPEEFLPYDLRKPSFKANPIPRACSVLIFDQMMKKQEQERQERIRKQAELNFSKAKLPDRMQMHAEKQKQQPYQKKVDVDEYAFKPKINDLVTREQFKKAQDKFNQKLNKKKSQMQVTQPRSPNFTKTSSKGLDREYLNEGQQAPPMDKFKAALMKNLASISEDKAGQNPSGTKSMTLAMQKRREELEAKRKAEEAKKKEEQERFERQNRMKTEVQSALKDRIKDDTQKRIEAMEKKKREARELEKEKKQEIQERIEKARARPLLVDSIHSKSQASNLAKIKATKEFVEVLKKNGVDPKEHLTEEQKELLAEEEYIQKRKKELGKI